MVFYGSLSDSKSPHVSRTLPSIPADLNNTIVLVVFTSRKIFKLALAEFFFVESE